MNIEIKLQNKSYDKRKISVTIDKKKYYIEPCWGWYSVNTTDLEIRGILRKIAIDNLYWLLGRDCDFEDWKHEIDKWDSGKGIYNTPIEKPSSIFFNTKEKETALNSFNNI